MTGKKIYKISTSPCGKERYVIFLISIHTLNYPHPPIKRGRSPESGNKGGDEILFLEREGVGLKGEGARLDRGDSLI